MKRIETTDNNGGDRFISCAENADLSSIANKTLAELQVENHNFLIFPSELGGNHDGVENECIFYLDRNRLTTKNIMGFIGINDTQLSIGSRFAPKQYYFIYYMLSKVFSVNLVNLPAEANNTEDMLIYILFPACLKKALAQGIFKQYKMNKYNDMWVRGTIDINRHIHLNTPFAGRIAYNAREFSYDNNVTELVRHTIEHIKSSAIWSTILTNDTDTRTCVREIIDATPEYKQNDRRKIIKANIKPLSHPYYTEYRELQRLCLMILDREKMSFGQDKDKAYGLIFDGSWLWEEYMNAVLRENNIDITHLHNNGIEGDNLFEDGQRIVPDFIKYNIGHKTAHYIADAKYKFEISSDDYCQIITYMYRYECKQGFILYPYKDGNKKEFIKDRKIVGKKVTITELGLGIPQKSGNFTKFCNAIKTEEEKFYRESPLL